jgi:hypothetical protein
VGRTYTIGVVPRPARRVDAETVKHLAAYAGLPLTEERAQLHAGLLNELVMPALDAFERERLGFWFEDRHLTFVRPAIVPDLREPYATRPGHVRVWQRRQADEDAAGATDRAP